MTTVEERPTQEMGSARRRKEDQRLITGRTRWTDNIKLPGMHHLAMVRSPFAHARITSIDTAAAKAASGVVAVLTGADVADRQGSLPCAWPITEDQKAPPHPSIAVDRVAFAGEIVACVIARTAAEARDAVELVDVEYDELPAVLDLANATAGGELAHPDLGTNTSARWIFDSAEAGTGGNVEDAIAEARSGGVLVERTFRQQRLIPAFMEPRSIVVDPTGEQTTMWSATQVPHILRLMLALTCGISESKLRVVAPDVGGGFGGKLQVTPEEVIALLAARQIGKPCKYTETRSESLVAAHHGRDQIQKITLAAKQDGTVTGLKVELLADMGAYLGLVTSGVPILGAFMYNSIYKFPAPTTSTAPTSSPTRPGPTPTAAPAVPRRRSRSSGSWTTWPTSSEWTPWSCGRKNWITHEEFPFEHCRRACSTTPATTRPPPTKRQVELFDYDALRAEQQRASRVR